MNTNKSNSSPGRSLRAIATCVIIAGATLALGVVDASAAGGGKNRSGSGGGGKLAQSSVSGANRSASASRNDYDRNRNNRNNKNVNINNSGNIRVGGNNNVNIDIDNDRHGCCYHGNNYHPILTGVVIGAVAVTTSAIIGSYYRTLPPSCTTVYRNGFAYYYCGTVYYQQTWSGDDIVYVVVNP